MLEDDFDFHKFIINLTAEELENFASNSGTTVQYLKNHLIYKAKIPRIDTIESLVMASKGKFTKAQFVYWLYDLKVA